MNWQMLWRWFFQLPIYLRLLITVLFSMLLFGLIIHLIEPNDFPSLFDGIWWAFVTGSTVGYGDFVPVTNLGKLIGILMILTGGGVVTYYMATVAAGAMRREKEILSGLVSYKGKNHIILIGWNERSRQLIEMINKQVPTDDIVLIDSSLEESPKKRNYHLQFIKGDPSLDDTLIMANIKEARFVIITADQSKEEKQADQLSILATVAVRGLNPKVSIVTEILLNDQVSNANRAGANTVLRSNDFMSTLFFHELYRSEPVKPFEIMLEQLASQQYNESVLPNTLVGKTFLDCSITYGKSNELLLGIIREGEMIINPPFQMTLNHDDRLIVLTSLRQ